VGHGDGHGHVGLARARGPDGKGHFVARDGFEILLLTLRSRTNTEVRTDQSGSVHAVSNTGPTAQFTGIGENRSDVVEGGGMALADQFKKLAEEFRNEASVLIIADDGDMGTAVDNAHLLGVLQVLPEFTILTQKLKGFFLIL
jgi:hypothetical protein